MRYLVFLLIHLWTPVMHAQERAYFPAIDVGVSRIGKEGRSVFEIHASAFARATSQQAWHILTDYDHLHEFVPDMASSKLLSRSGREAIVEQHSRASFLFIVQSIHMVVRVEEHPFSAIDVNLVSGDMRYYRAHWSLQPSTLDGQEGTRITFNGTMEPDFFVPPLLGSSIVQANIRKMIEAVVAEIERRGAH